MAFVQSSPRRTVGVGLIVLILAFGSLHFDDRDGRPGPIGTWVNIIVSPFNDLCSTWGRNTRNIWLGYVALWDVRADNEVLKRRVASLESQAARVDELEAENKRLSELLEFADSRKDLRLSSARVVSRSNSPLFRVMSLTLDTGSEERVEVGQSVLSARGVIGQIRSVSGSSAEVLLLTDPRSAVDVILEQSKARGLAIGTGDPRSYTIRLEYLERNARIVPGERVLTTGDAGVYPRGLYLGSVALKAQEGAQPFRRAEVRPGVDPSALEEVFVVLGPSGLSVDGSRFESGKRAQP